MYAHSYDYARIDAPRARPVEGPGRRMPSGRRWARNLLLVAVAVILVGLVSARVAQGGLTPAPQTVTVRPGDTLWSIAAVHYPQDDPRDRVQDIERLNHLDGPIVQVGAHLVLPSG
jgi:LysM repeat protein